MSAPCVTTATEVTRSSIIRAKMYATASTGAPQERRRALPLRRGGPGGGRDPRPEGGVLLEVGDRPVLERPEVELPQLVQRFERRPG